MSAAKPSGTPPSVSTDDLTLVVNGKSFGGWQEVSVTRGIEIMPSHFDITLTERDPTSSNVVAIQPGQSVAVKIGKDTVITGYIDRYIASITPNDHRVRIMGRGKCRDLVDCSAGIFSSTFFNMQVNGLTAKAIATTFALPFDITVTANGAENDLPIPIKQVNFGETPYDIIDRIAQYRGLLAYEGSDGNLILGAVGTQKMASGFAAPGNIISANVSLSSDQRYSDYFVVWTSTDTLMQIAASQGVPSGVQRAHLADKTLPKQTFRPRAIVSEQTMGGNDFALRRAAWEMNRNNGRAQVVSLTCDSWRDGAGKLWQPNMLAPVDIPACKISKQMWIIAQVTFRRGEDGDYADLVLMPPGAFSPQPTALAGVNYQLAQAIKTGAASPGNPTGGSK